MRAKPDIELLLVDISQPLLTAAYPFSAHCRDYVSHEFSLQLVTQCLIPGSYALDAVATVRTRSHAERRFSMFRFKRYDEALLAESLARFGWEELVSLPIGESERAPVAMLLVKR